MTVQQSGLLYEEVHAGLSGEGGLDVVADAALGGYIRDEALHGLGVDAGRVAHVGVAVGVGVGAGDIV